jgi:hypothetical protein
MKALELITEIIGWIRIVISPTSIGLLLGGICYFNLPGPWGLVAGIALAATGLVIGIVIATRAFKRKGTVHLLSRTMATPELDDPEP